MGWMNYTFDAIKVTEPQKQPLQAKWENNFMFVRPVQVKLIKQTLLIVWMAGKGNFQPLHSALQQTKPDMH